MLTTVNRLWKLRNATQTALIDVKETTVLTDGDFNTIHEIVSALEPVMLVVENLCSRKTTLASVDAAMRLAVVQLKKQSSELAKVLSVALCSGIEVHRTDLTGVLQYLHNLSVSSDDETFSVPARTTIRWVIFNLVKRLEHAGLCYCAFISLKIN